MAQYDASILIDTKINTKNASEQLMALKNRIVKTADKVKSLRSKMDALKGVKIPTQEYTDVQKQIEVTEKKINDLIARQEKFLATGGKTESSAFQKMQYDLEELQNSLPYLKSELKDLIDTGKAFTLGSDTEKYVKLGQQLKYAENDMEALIQKQDLLKLKSGDVKTSYVGLAESVKNSFSLIVRGLKDIPIALVKKGIDGIKSTFKGLGNVAKKVLSSAGSNLKKLASSMLGFGKSAKTSSGHLSSIGSSLKTMIKYGLGIRSLYVLFNKLRSAIKEGFGNLANENESFKSSVNSLKASLLTLKNAIAGAFAPIVQIAIPYIQQLVGWITSAVQAIGQFIAALTGRSTYIKAIKQTAGAFEDAAGSAKDAEKAAEGYLSPLDEINKYSDGKDKGAGSGGGGAGGVGQMFEEVPIESKFKEFADKLKSFIKSEDWEGLGAYIASGINKGLQKLYDLINWNNVEPRITYFVNAFTRTLNSIVDNIDWDLMGRVVGAGINTFVNTMNLLIEGIDWQNLGKKFSEGIMGIVREVNWENVGRFFGNKFMILWNTLYGLVMNLKYDEIGVAIGNGFNGAVKAINLGTLGATLGKAITGIFQTAINFSEIFDWKALGKNISNGINRFFQEFNGKTMAQGATKLISGILDTLIEAIATTDWSRVWKDIIDFLVNVDWLGLIKKFHIAVWYLVLGLFEGLVQAIAETDWKSIWKSILEAFKSFWQIHSPSKIMAEMGKFLIQGLLEGINSLADTVSQAWQSMKDTAVSIWINTKDSLATTWENIKNTAKTTFDIVKTNIATVWNNAKENTRSSWENMKSNASTSAQTIASNIRSKYEDIKSSIRSFASSAPSIWRSAWDNMRSTVSSILSSIRSAISSAFSWISSKISSIGSSFRSLTSRVSSSGSSSFARSAYSVASPYAIYPEMQALSTAEIPGYATGQVIPTTMKKHLAWLGDNTQETEVVSPLSTIRQALREEAMSLGLSGNGGNDNLTLKVYLEDSQLLNPKKIFEAVITEGKVQQMSTGKNRLLLEN